MQRSGTLLLTFRAFFLVAVIAVTVLSLGPVPEQAGLESDKTGHLIAYGVLALLLTISLPPERPAGTAHWRFVAAAAALVAYGGVLEVIQHFVGRDMDFLDALANAAGTAIGAGIGVAARRFARSGRPSGT